MNQQAQSKDEIRAFIVWYIKAACDAANTETLTLKQHRQLQQYISEELDITESLIRDRVITGEHWKEQWYLDDMLTALFEAGRCPDLALDEAKEWIGQCTFRRSEPPQEQDETNEARLKDWLLCRCDHPSESVPVRMDCNYIFDTDYTEALFAAMTRVCDFPVRYCAYVLCKGRLFQFKYAFRSLIVHRGAEFADTVLQRMKQICTDDFGLSSEQTEILIMCVFTAVYCSADKKKPETAYYQKYTDKWMAEEQDRFLGIIRNEMNPDLRKKVLKKLTGSSK